MVRRKLRERSSKAVALEVNWVLLEFMIELFQKGFRLLQLPRLHIRQGRFILIGKTSARLVVRNKLIQQNATPLQPEQRIQELGSFLEGNVTGETLVHKVDKPLLMAGGQLHGRMQQKIGNDLGGIIPTKVLKVDQCQATVRSSNSVVEAKVRRTQRAQADIEFGFKAPTSSRTSFVTPIADSSTERQQLLV